MDRKAADLAFDADFCGIAFGIGFSGGFVEFHTLTAQMIDGAIYTIGSR